MDTKLAGALGGKATAANRTPEERAAAMSHAATMRWAKTAKTREAKKQADRKRDAHKRWLASKAKHDKARRVGKIAAASRKANR